MKTKRNIVIVEDHPMMRRGLALWFAETKRWNVWGEAANLDEAAALFQAQGETDIVLLDLKLGDPHKNDTVQEIQAWGLDLIPLLKARFGAKAPPCVVYSAFDDWAHVSAALTAGARGYVSKKSGEAELEQALEIVLSGAEYVETSLMRRLIQVTSILDRLTRRETEVFKLAKEGITSRQIGVRLGISSRTVDNILSLIYDKTGVHDRKELMKL